MALTPQTFLTHYPEFSQVPPDAIAAGLAESELMLGRAVWGVWFDLAKALRTAHYLALDFDIAAPAAALGRKDPCETSTVTSMSAGVGSLSISKSTSALLSSDDPEAAGYARTTYGLKFMALMNAIIPAAGLSFTTAAAARARGERA